MTGLLVGEGYGRVVAFRGDEAALDAVARVLPFWWQGSTEEPEHVVDVRVPAAAHSAVRDLERWVAEHAVGLVFVHAAVVAIDDRALLLPGRSFAGKTTLCVELLSRGATYLSDEYAVLSHDGFVHPYPRPIQLRDDGINRVLAEPSAFGADVGTGRLPVAAVALLRFEQDREWQVVDLTPAVAVLRLLDHTLCAQTRPEEALSAVVAAVRGTCCVEGVRGDAGVAADAVGALLRRT